MAKYKIRIDKIVTEERTVTEYQKVADTGNDRDGKSIYDYVPVVKSIINEEKVLECIVDDMNINAVIKSIYKL